MAARSSTRLPALLGIAVVCAGLAAGSILANRRIGELKAGIAHYSQLAMQMEGQDEAMSRAAGGGPSVDEMRQAVEEERARFYRAGEITAAEFAETIQAELARAGLRVSRYRPVAAGPEGGLHAQAEFAAAGAAEDFLSFLRDSSASKRYRSFSSVAVRGAGSSGGIQVTFRVDYEEDRLDNAQ